MPESFLLTLPKAELHLHLEGSVDPPTLSELSRRHPTPLSTTNNRYRNIEDSGRVFTEDEARALYQYQDFTGFLLAFKAVTERLRTADDYELVTYRMMQKLQRRTSSTPRCTSRPAWCTGAARNSRRCSKAPSAAASAANATSACRCIGSWTPSATSAWTKRSAWWTRPST